ncbi:outer membrane protein [Terrihabitans sp. B22-R8]|uniref:outer membrane protein n=1 Tax=Terrihabitans sp. B22-R8 TaxID=3425128 RepID=UPI00403C4FBE
MSKKLALLVIMAASAAPVAVRAADMPKIAPLDIAVQRAGYDWTGAYAGVNAGYSLGEFGTFTPAEGSDSFSGNGVLGGFQIGYNRQLGSVVIGVEGDVQASGIDGSTSFPAGATTESQLSWFSTVRGRVGYAFDRTLVYGTAGGAVAGLETEAGGVSDDQTAWGLAAGAGVERALTDKLTLKAEYLYLDLQDKGVDTGVPDQNSEWDGHVMRFGANFKF